MPRTTSKTEPKYEPLRRYLSTAPRPASMSFDQIGRLVGGLPPSAFVYSAWWANDRTHVQAHAWLDLRIVVEAVDLGSQIVRFR